MKTAIYPGSFDPVTNGHLNIIQRAAKSFDRLIVCVMFNVDKHPMFYAAERVELIRRVTADIPNVEVMFSDKLLADFAREQGSSIIVKGLRAVSDFEREFQMALVNHKLNPGLDTMFLTAEHQFMYLSSSAVKELGRYDVALEDFLPAAIIPDFKARMAGQIGGGHDNEMVQDAWSLPLGNEKCVVERDKVLDLLDEISNQLPGELKQAKTIVESRNEVITNAKREAENILKQAEQRAKQMISREEITRQAAQQADEMVKAAQQKIKELKQVTNDYVDDAMKRTEDAIAQSLSEIRESRTKFRALVNPQAAKPSPIIEDI